MTVEELVKLTKGKRDYDYSKHVKIKYMPYSQKLAMVKSIIDNTSYAEAAGIKVYKRNSNAMMFVFTMQLIEHFTDVEIDVANISKDYDTLMESNVMHGLMNAIPKDEISMLSRMLDMERDDLEINTRSIVSFLETKTEAMQLALEKFEKIITNPALQAKINNTKK